MEKKFDRVTLRHVAVMKKHAEVWAKIVALLVAAIVSSPRILAQVEASLHQQIVPSGWSAVNSDRNINDDRIAHLIPAPPEGTLFFKFLGDDWDVNQFQWGRWNFEDQVIEAGDSGLIFNPGAEFELEWSGVKQELPVFSGFLSGNTAISRERIGSEAIFGTTLWDYLPEAQSTSPRFDDAWPVTIPYTFLGIWAPGSDFLVGDPDQILFVSDPGSTDAPVHPERRIGKDIYINNYVPGFEVDSPDLSQRLNDPCGLIREGAGLAGGTVEFFLQSGNSRDLLAELPMWQSGPHAGYLDVQGGATYSLPVGWEGTLAADGFIGLGRFSQERSGEFPPRPPEVIQGWFSLSAKRLVNPLGPFCGMPIAFDRSPADFRIAEGGDLVIPIGICENLANATGLFKRAVEGLITFHLEKRVEEHWNQVAVSEDFGTFVLPSVSFEDTGTYRYRYDDVDIDNDCAFTQGFDHLFSQEFEVLVEPRDGIPDPAGSGGLETGSVTLVRDGDTLMLQWEGPGRLQQSAAVDGPFQDSANQSNPQRVDVSGTANRFFRLFSE